jgi:hypothetical protein
MNWILTVTFILLSFLFCFSQQDNKWNHVHHPSRLNLLKKSITITGIVYRVAPYIDGDYDIEIRLDSCNYLLGPRNYTKQDSCLVVEIVCATKSIFSKCNCYENKILIPKKGDHVKITGDYIWDKIHRWYEIHPVDSLSVLK